MGYYERKIGEGLFAGVMLVCLVCLVAAGPWIIGNAIGGNVLGWVFELIYIALIIWLVVAQVRKLQARRGRGYWTGRPRA